MDSAGDVNKDGYADVIIGAFGNNASTGKVYVYLGSASGLGTSPAWTATGEASNDTFGHSVASAGDVNGDGFADVIVGAPFRANYQGKVYVYLGSSSGLGTAAAWTATGASGYFGWAIASAGDVNKDGYADVIIGAHAANSSAGLVHVYFGSASGLGASPAWTGTGEGTLDSFGWSVAGAGDVNNDGYADIIVGATGVSSFTGKTYVFLGSATGPAATPAWTATGEANYANFGHSVAGAGDVNGDGYAEVLVGAYNNNSGAGKAYAYYGLVQSIAPAITTQPADQTVNAGGTATFSAAASGSPAPTVQWQYKPVGALAFVNFPAGVPGANSPTFSFTASAADNGQQYRAVFTNATGTATTNAATLTVNTPPSITTQPGNQAVNAGGTASFSAAAGGSPAPTVQWQVSTDGSTWTDIPSATSTTLSFTAQASDNGKQYRAVFTNSVSSATTNAATLTVNTPPAITAQPSNQTVTAGGTATFNAAASGSPAPTVQWQVSTDGSTWTDISGATGTTLSFAAQAADNGKQYRAVFTNSVSSATTNAATLTVNTPPSITTQPGNQAVNAGGTASFSAAAGGSPAPTVQWQSSTDGSNWTDISGATGATLSFTTQAGDNGKQYRAVFTNTAGTATTNAATLTVTSIAPLTIAVASGGTCTADGTAKGAINLTVGSSTGAAGLTLKLVSNSNPTLVPNSGVVFGGSGANRTMTVTAAPKKYGKATLSIGVSDGTSTTTVPVTVIVGRNDENVLIGTSGADMIFGRNDEDWISGGDGNDLLCGGNGADWINGGKGDDTLIAGRGNDVLTGGLGADRFSGGPGKDLATDFTPSQGDTQDGTVEVLVVFRSSADVAATGEAIGPTVYNWLYLPTLQK